MCSSIYASLVTLALAVGSATATNPLYTSNEILNREAFRQYLVDFGKGTYGSEEHERRYVHFLNNLKLADARNAAEGPNGARHGITRFSDMSPEEFKAFLSADPNTKSQGLRGAMKEKAPMSEMRSDPRSGDSKDWTGTLTTPVKNQAQCGSCWAFSTMEGVESAVFMSTGKLPPKLSVQELVACEKQDDGCDGGDIPEAVSYLKQKGMATQSDYPDTSSKSGSSGRCKSFQPDVKVTGMQYAIPPCNSGDCSKQNEEALAAALAKYGKHSKIGRASCRERV